MTEGWADWSSYRPGDFLMFSPRVYARLFELVNEAWWPLQLLLVAAAWPGLQALARGRGWRPLGMGLGAAWLFCAAVFLHQRYLPIYWAVAWLLPAVVVLALLLPWLGWHAAAQAQRSASRRRAAVALAAWALLLHPLLAPLSGAGWRQAEVFALAPDPTAIATLALLLALPRLPTRPGRALAALAWGLALAWCAFSAFTLATMERWSAVVPLLAVALAAWASRRRRR